MLVDNSIGKWILSKFKGVWILIESVVPFRDDTPTVIHMDWPTTLYLFVLKQVHRVEAKVLLIHNHSLFLRMGDKVSDLIRIMLRQIRQLFTVFIQWWLFSAINYPCVQMVFFRFVILFNFNRSSIVRQAADIFCTLVYKNLKLSHEHITIALQ